MDVDVPTFRLRGEERSSSDQSCDTVIQLDTEGLVQSRTAPRLAQPEFVPIIPSLHPNKADMEDPEFTALLQELLRIPQMQGSRKTEETVTGNIDVLKTDVNGPVRDCLKCDTFAELQERLGCIDGSEIMEVLKSSTKLPPASSVGEKSQQQKQADRETEAKTSETPQASLNQGTICSKSSVAEKQTDGALPGDRFQREDSGLYDCEECSATSSGEELLNQSLKRTCRPDQARNGAPKSKDFKNSQGSSADSQEAAPNSTLSHEPAVKQESQESVNWFKADKRTSPVGKSAPISPPSSCSSSRSLTNKAILGNTLPDRPTEDFKEMKATITVTVQQPLDLKGHDELVFSMVEEVTISGALNQARAGGNIICIRDASAAQVSSQGSASSQPIRIISNVADESEATDYSMTSNTFCGQMNETKTKTSQGQLRREMRILPSFINPMLINADTDCEMGNTKDKETPLEVRCELKSGHLVKSTDSDKIPEKNLVKMLDKGSDSKLNQTYHDTKHSKDLSWCDKTADDKGTGKRPRSAEKSHHREGERVFSANLPRASEPVEICSRRTGGDPERVGPATGCQETASPPFNTSGSLPRGWQDAIHPDNYRSGYLAEDCRVPRGVISSTPCSPDVTLKRKQGKHSRENLHISAPRKHSAEHKQHAFSCVAPRKSAECLLENSNRRGDHLPQRLTLSPTEDGGRHFGAKLEHLVIRSSSLGRSPRDYLNMDRDSSSTSMSSKGSSKASAEGACKGGYRGHSDRDYTLPRVSRSPRKNPRSDHSYHFFPPEDHGGQSGRYSHSKLSAVGKLKLAGPKVRRLSASSIKNLSLPHKSLRQSVNRSASLSPDSKTVSFERMSSFLSSSPPRSFRSISRTPSQSSTCSSTKSAIQCYVNGRFSDLLRERNGSPTLGDSDQMQTALPSPYSRVTAPRTPDHLSGHASDTTSVLSGDLPPAMGKTSLYFSGRNSAMSSGYDSMVRESEATGSGASARDSISDRSSSLLSVARSGRSSRRRNNAGKKPGTMGFL